MDNIIPFHGRTADKNGDTCCELNMNIPCHLHYFLPGLDTLPSIPKYQEAWAT
jgi:hypothetical protein